MPHVFVCWGLVSWIAFFALLFYFTLLSRPSILFRHSFPPFYFILPFFFAPLFFFSFLFSKHKPFCPLLFRHSNFYFQIQVHFHLSITFYIQPYSRLISHVDAHTTQQHCILLTTHHDSRLTTRDSRLTTHDSRKLFFRYKLIFSTQSNLISSHLPKTTRQSFTASSRTMQSLADHVNPDFTRKLDSNFDMQFIDQNNFFSKSPHFVSDTSIIIFLVLYLQCMKIDLPPASLIIVFQYTKSSDSLFYPS